MAKKVTVDQSLCIGCGNCASACPECFEMVDGKSHVKDTCDDRKCDLQAVADNCPVMAITVIDE
jgi:ferredoxin